MEDSTNAAAQVARAMLAEVIDRCQKHYDKLHAALEQARAEVDFLQTVRERQREQIEKDGERVKNLTHHLTEASDRVARAEDELVKARTERDEWKEKANVLCESALRAQKERDEALASLEHARIHASEGWALAKQRRDAIEAQPATEVGP